MGEITERRLKCDYCGNVSPVLTRVEPMPKGWQEIIEFHYQHSETYRINNKVQYFFCCEAHKRAWLAQREPA